MATIGNWANKKQKPSKNQEDIRNTPIINSRFNTVSYRKTLRVFFFINFDSEVTLQRHYNSTIRYQIVLPNNFKEKVDNFWMKIYNNCHSDDGNSYLV